MNSASRFLFYWGPFLLYCVLILSLSSLPKVPVAPQAPDKVLHFVEYFIYAFLLWRALASGIRKRASWPDCAVLLTVSAGFGALDEYRQSFVPGRYSRIGDWYADVAGILAMITFILVKSKYREMVSRVR